MNEELTAAQTPPLSGLQAIISFADQKTIMQVAPKAGGAPVAEIDMTSAIPSWSEFLPCAAHSQLAMYGYEIVRSDYDEADPLSGFQRVIGYYNDGEGRKIYGTVAPGPPPGTTYVATAYLNGPGLSVTVTTEATPGRPSRGIYDGVMGGVSFPKMRMSRFDPTEVGQQLTALGWLPVLITQDTPGLENGWHRHAYGITVPVRPVALPPAAL